MQTLILPSEAFNSVGLIIDDSNSINSEAARTTHNYHCFMIGTIGALIDENQYCEIFKKENLCNIPLTPAWFKGVINLRGNSVPVVDLNHYYDMPSIKNKKSQQSHILAIGKNKNICGIEIPEFPYKIQFSDDDIFNANVTLPKGLHKHIDRIYEKDKLWIQLNTESLFSQLFSQMH